MSVFACVVHRFGSHAPPVLLHRNSKRKVWELLGSGEALADGIDLTSGDDSTHQDSSGDLEGFRTVPVACIGPETAARAGVGFSHLAYVIDSQVWHF